MSSIGYYRYKVDNLPEGVNNIAFYKNGQLAVTHSVIVKPFCEDERLVKYLDKNGQYRFYPFNRYWESKDKPKSIGTTNKLITSILSGLTNKQNVGVKNERSITLVASDVPETELEILQDLWVSPRVYLYIGSTNADEAKDWIEVTVSGGDTTSKRKKQISGKISITVELPEWFSVSML